MKAHRPKDPCIPLKIRDIRSIKIAIPNEQEFGHLLWMIFTAAETGEYDEAAAAELSIAARDWYDRMFADCCRNIFQYNARNKGACFDEKIENKGACFDDDTGHCPHAYTGGQTDNIAIDIDIKKRQGNDSALCERADRDSQPPKTIFPYPEPPNAAETIYRAAINSDFQISAEETIRFYSTMAATGWRDKYGKPVRDWRKLLKSWQGRQSRENRTSGERLFQEYSRNGGFYMPDAIQNLDRMFNQTATERDQTADPNQIPNSARIAARRHNPGDCSDPDGDTWTDPDTFSDPASDPDDEPDPDGDRYHDSG